MKYRVIQSLLIIFILCAQVAEAFVTPATPCPNMNAMSVMDEALGSDSHAGNYSDTSTSDFMNDSDCCIQECGCDAGMVTLPMLINAQSSAHVNLSSLKINPAHPSFFTLYLSQAQRPPKPFIS